MQLSSPAGNGGALRQQCAQALLDGIPPVVWSIRWHMRRHRAAGLSVPQFRMLCQLDQNPTACLSAAAETLGYSLPGASRLVSGLKAKKFVRRTQSDSDRRSFQLELTGQGQEALRAARRATRRRLAAEIRGLDAAEQRSVIAVMQKLQGTFEAAAAGARGHRNGTTR
jgi:DNA-binding MarR family transcriptional regulator